MSAFRAKATNLLGALQSTVGTAIEMLTTVKVGKSKGANLLHIECLACQSKASQPVTSSGSSGVAVCSVLEFVRKARAVEARDCSSQIGNARLPGLPFGQVDKPHLQNRKRRVCRLRFESTVSRYSADADYADGERSFLIKPIAEKCLGN